MRKPSSRGGGPGWPFALALLFFAVLGASSMIDEAGASESPSGGELITYVFPSPRGIDWSSPRRLAWTSITNLLRFKFEREHNIGHVNVEVRCPVPGQSVSQVVVSGMTSKNGNETTKAVLWDQIGLGSLFHNFGGRLETREEIEAQWPERKRHGELAVIRHRISSSTCERLLQFEREYRASGAQENYGLPNRPRYGEGAGCSAYGIAYLELAGVLSEEMQKRWSRMIRVPEDMIGGAGTRRLVPIGSILLSFWRKWAKADEPHREIVFWDPDAMYQWIQEVHSSDRGDYSRSQVGAVKVIHADASEVPTPTEPIWLEQGMN